jgi:alkanesulfonate monooxygenase SsuD/methylene tetrahydromethanopterin reductase-like flavin-dependent oxidoreductase (luciferase family)
MGRGFGVAAAVGPDVVGQIAQAAEQHGYTSFWVNDTPGADGLAALASAASVTGHIRLGVGVIALDRRRPDTIADDVERLNLPQDRLYVGVGSGGDPKGLDLVRDGVDVLHQRLSAPVIVGALGPRMSALAGERGDGVLFNWQTPEFAVKSGQWVIDAADEAGRPHPQVMAYVRTALLPQGEARMDEESSRYARFPKYAAHFKRMGVSARNTGVASDDPATLQGRLAEHDAALDEAIVRAITPNDSAASILELLEACAPPKG